MSDTGFGSMIITATVPPTAAGAGSPARFALELAAGDDPAVRADAVRAAVADELGREPVVRPMSVLDRGVLVLELPDRVLAPHPNPAAFAAADALVAAHGLRAAEPDLPTDLFPTQSTGSTPFTDEGGGGIPGCFVTREPELADSWSLDAIRVPGAWALSREQGRREGGEGVVVGQPDTGILPGHPELIGVRRVAGRDLLDGDDDPTDPLAGGLLVNPGHGTGTASVAVSPRSGRVTGSAPSAAHMPIRAVESVVRLTQLRVAEAVDWAVDHGAHVVSMSLGGIPSFTLHRALVRAVAADVIVLAAAGNCVREVVWPARYDDCIAVAGTDAADELWVGSCRGAAVDVAAPGQNVWRAGRPDVVDQGQGTSFAVALTAGVAACWLAHHGRAAVVGEARARGETVQAMFRRLLTATVRAPEGWDTLDHGAGIVDARALLAAPLDLGTGTETTGPADDPEARAARSVASLVASVVGPRAVDDDLDWHRFGAEVAAVLLGRPVAGVLGTEAPPATPVSGPLARAVTNPALRDALGIDDRAVPEVAVVGDEPGST